MRKFVTLIAGALALSGASLSAQVGYPPAKSPYLDLEQSQELTLLVGNFHAHRDPADVGPQPGTLVGLHYEWRAGGPFHLLGELDRISSDRNLINPFKAGPGRDLGTVSRPLWAADAGFGLSLTGAKSWHHLVPEISSGVGVVSDLRTQPDTGGFRFGTRFAFNFGGGLRWVPTGRWQLRADINDRLYSMAYPEAFFVAPAGGAAVVSAKQAKSFWTNNPALTLGISRLF